MNLSFRSYVGFDYLFRLLRLSNHERRFVMPGSMIEDRVVSIVLDPRVGGFVEAESSEHASNFSELCGKDFPENVDGVLGCGINSSKGCVEIVMIPSLIEFILHDAFKVSEIEEEPLIIPGVTAENRSLNCNLKDVSMPMGS
jgi:hypothetical protein